VASKPRTTRATWSRSTREPDGNRPGNPAFRRVTNDSGRPLDSLAREAIDRCAELITLGGYSPKQSAERFGLGCERVHAAAGGRTNQIPADIDLNAHVLTLWSQERDYLLPDGQWRPLPASGPTPSIEALVNMVGRGLTFKKVLADLLSNGSLRREGRLYLPSETWVAHPSNSPSQLAHHMRVFVEFLRTLDHNRRARRPEQRLFEFAADNTAVPVSQLAALNRYLHKTGHAFLKDKDFFMHRLARGCKDGEPTVPVTIGLYLSQPRKGTAGRRTRKSK